MSPTSFDVAIVGGGVVGLSLAWELVRRGVRVCVLERGAVGRESSWAGAGIIYPADLDSCRNPFERLRAESYRRWPVWVDELRANTGVDPEFLRCGSIVLDADPQELERLAAELHCETIPQSADDLARIEPGLHENGLAARLAPGVCQVRNPRLLKALRAACENTGVAIHESAAMRGFVKSTEGAVRALRSESGDVISAERIVVCAGAWSGKLLAEVGVELPVRPIRGQILQLFAPNAVRHIVELGKHYVVPRADGRVLVGSTEEDVGFDKSTTDEALAELRALAVTLFPALADAPIENAWAGLRPSAPFGVPYLTHASDDRNLWIAAGHFRLGLQLSVGTAVLLADWLTERPSFANPDEFGFQANREALGTSFSA